MHLFRLLPLVLVWCEVVVLVGILDEGAKIKYLTEHDKTFQFPRFFWSMNSPLAQCNASVEMQSWFQDHKDDPVNCAAFGAQLANFSSTIRFGSNDFFDLYESSNGASFSSDLTWVLTHCFPWAYADVCANLLSTSSEIDVAAAIGLGGCNSTQMTWDTCAYRNCYLPIQASTRFGGKSRVSVEMWQSVIVPWAEIDQLVTLAQRVETSVLITDLRQHRAVFLSVYAETETKKVYDANSEFICWFMKQMLNRRKVFSSTPDDISIYLYEKFHWIYALGVGETHIVELITIVFLSFYVYATAMFDELMQLLYQLRAHNIFSGPAYVHLLFHGSTFSGAGGATIAEDSFPSSHYALRYVQVRSARGCTDSVDADCGSPPAGTWIGQVVVFGIFCDVFMSLRVIYFACMIQVRLVQPSAKARSPIPGGRRCRLRTFVTGVARVRPPSFLQRTYFLPVSSSKFVEM